MPAYDDQRQSQTRISSGCSSAVAGVDALGLVDLRHGEEHDQGQDHHQEDHAGARRPEAQAAVLVRLRHAVADRGAQRAGQDVGQPEREHRVELQEVSARR